MALRQLLVNPAFRYVSPVSSCHGWQEKALLSQDGESGLVTEGFYYQSPESMDFLRADLTAKKQLSLIARQVSSKMFTGIERMLYKLSIAMNGNR